MSFGVTANGFVLKTLQDIIADMEAEAKVQFGNDVDLTSTSPLKKFIQVIAAEQARLWQVLETVYYSGYLDFAVGQSLDNLVTLLGFVRRAAIKATGQVTFYGLDGTQIPANTEIQTSGDSPIVFVTDSPVTISGGSATVNITAKVAGSNGNVAANTITVLTNPIAGVTSVTNQSATTGGRDAESDEEFRNRVKQSLSSAGAATLDAIRAGVLQVTGVTSVNVEENDTTTDYTGTGGLPPKSFRVLVLGGANDDIAQAIFDNKPAGIQSYGSQSGTAYDDAGNSYTMYFERATEVAIYVNVTLTKDSTFPQDGNKQVETAIISYIGGVDADGNEHIGLGIGEDVIYNEVVAAVMSVQGVVDAVVYIDTSSPPTGTSNITISSTQKAKTGINEVNIA